MANYVIVGAAACGLYTAYRLLQSGNLQKEKPSPCTSAIVPAAASSPITSSGPNGRGRGST